MQYCIDCDAEYEVIYDNVAWLSSEYCPFCGGQSIKVVETDEIDDVEEDEE
jgi:hypothetical protein